MSRKVVSLSFCRTVRIGVTGKIRFHYKDRPIEYNPDSFHIPSTCNLERTGKDELASYIYQTRKDLANQWSLLLIQPTYLPKNNRLYLCFAKEQTSL